MIIPTGTAVEIYADSKKAGVCNICRAALLWGQTTRDKMIGFAAGAEASAARLHTTNGRLILKMKAGDIHDCNPQPKAS